LDPTDESPEPVWGAPYIHRELRKLGIAIGETSVAKYMVGHRKPPSQTWRTFLNNHVKDLVAMDFFTVPTIRFQVLSVFVALAHQQLRKAIPFDQIPRYLLRDRDKIFGDDQAAEMGVYLRWRESDARVSSSLSRSMSQMAATWQDGSVRNSSSGGRLRPPQPMSPTPIESRRERLRSAWLAAPLNRGDDRESETTLYCLTIDGKETRCTVSGALVGWSS
jgi:hypothetical protein